MGTLPSEATVAALATTLRLDVEELLAIQRAATVPKAAQQAGVMLGPGKPIGLCDPLDSEVHPAGGEERGARDAESRLPGYVQRDHDADLARIVSAAITGRSAMAVLVGSSSTGKTRACWEAVQPLDRLGWRLWHPFDPSASAYGSHVSVLS